jgi:hypothetical protein
MTPPHLLSGWLPLRQKAGLSPPPIDPSPEGERIVSDSRPAAGPPQPSPIWVQTIAALALCDREQRQGGD